MEDQKNLGKKLSVIKTVFAYKINVALAAILIFLNVQTLVSVTLGMGEIGMTPVLTSSLLTMLSLMYGLFSFNGYLTKIVMHENGFVMKSLFSETIVYGDEIKKVIFSRVNLRKMTMRILFKETRAKEININSTKYIDTVPLVEFLANYKG
ncbi:MAG: hypothetical protein FWE34_02080 [Defluviitaleaceae bacterium]|nr:hypothetical protein [Defluviitaleaceae bacterium]